MTPPPLISLERIQIILTTDSSNHFKGFSFKYQFNVCGGNVTEPTLIQPSTTSEELFYPKTECVWNITAPKGKIIKIKFESIAIFMNVNCKWSSVQVFDSIPEAADNSTLLAKMCGYHTSNPPTFRTTSNVATIRFSPGRSTRSTTFSALIYFVYGKEAGCGGEINLAPRETKTISFPRITSEFLSEVYLDCHWTVQTSPLHVISYKVRSLNLAANCSAGAQCNCNYVEIHNGLSVTDNLLGRYCGRSNTPGVELTSSGSFLSVTGIMNKIIENENFEIEVSTETSICGERILEVNDTVQELISPGYPNSYPPNIHCEWIIMAPYKEVNVHIMDLDLQESVTCSADRLEIFGKQTSPMLGANIIVGNASKILLGDALRVPESSSIFQGHMEQGSAVFCGHVKEFNYYSRGNIKLKFISDSAGGSKGFKLHYGLAECNRNYTTHNGRITKSFTQKPCVLIIDVSHDSPDNTTLSLYFSELLVNFSPDCSKGKIEVYDGDNDKARKLLSSCGYGNKPPIYTSGPKAMIKFINNGMTSAHLDISYTSTDKGQGCGGSMFNQAGYFTSPFYPSNYRNDSLCRWDISVPVGNVPELIFTEFQLGRKITCDSNFVEIYDVAEETGIEILQATFCGQDKPKKIIGTGRKIVVKYWTNIHNDGIGWAARFMAKKISTSRDYEISHPTEQSGRSLS